MTAEFPPPPLRVRWLMWRAARADRSGLPGDTVRAHILRMRASRAETLYWQRHHVSWFHTAVASAVVQLIGKAIDRSKV